MRLLVAFLLIFAASPALAAEWTRYENDRFGYTVDVPPGYVPDGEADNADGQIFVSNRNGLLRVYGGNTLASSFEESVGRAMALAEEQGWSLSYQRVTPRWASFSGTRNGQILYARAISLCGGSQFASFEFEYPRRDLERMHRVVERLVRSLDPTGRGVDC